MRPAREKDLSDDVDVAGTPRRPLATDDSLIFWRDLCFLVQRIFDAVVIRIAVFIFILLSLLLIATGPSLLFLSSTLSPFSMFSELINK